MGIIQKLDDLYDKHAPAVIPWVIHLGFSVGAAIIVLMVGFYGATVFGLLHNSAEAENLRWYVLGFVGLVSLPFLGWRTWISERQTQTAIRESKTGENRLLNESFVKAVELLGATREVGGKPEPAMELRLGAIYALEKISKDAPDDYFETVMDILSAYIRQNSPAVEGVVPTQDNLSPVDIQTVFVVLCRRVRQDYGIMLEKVFLNFEYLKRHNYDFDKKYNFEISGFLIENSVVNLGECYSYNFSGTNFSSTTFHNTIFCACEFGKKFINGAFDKCIIVNTEFLRIDSKGRNIYQFYETDFQGCSFPKSIELKKDFFLQCTFDEHTTFADTGLSEDDIKYLHAQSNEILHKREAENAD